MVPYYYTQAQRYKYSAYGIQMSNDNIFTLNTAGELSKQLSVYASLSTSIQ